MKKGKTIFGDDEWVDPDKYPDSKLNIHPGLPVDEQNNLTADIKKIGQTKPAWVWRKELIAGKHRRNACRELGIQLWVRHIADQTPVEEVISLIDRDNFIGRDYTPEKRAALIWKRFHGLISQMKHGGDLSTKAKTPDGVSVNVTVYISRNTGLSLRTTERTIKLCKIMFMKKPVEPVRARVDFLSELRRQARKDALDYIKKQNYRNELLSEVEGIEKEMKEIEVRILSALTPDSKGPRKKKLEAVLRLVEKGG